MGDSLSRWGERLKASAAMVARFRLAGLSGNRLWVFAMTLPMAALALSWVFHPHLFLVAITNQEATPNSTIKTLYTSGRSAVYFTTADLLHPEKFGRPGEFFDGLVFKLPPNEGNVGGGLRIPTWFLQISRAIRLKDPEGMDVEGRFPSDADIHLAEKFADWTETFRDKVGVSLAFPISGDATMLKLTGIRTIVGFSFGGNAAPDRERVRQGLEQTLTFARKVLLEAGGHGIGISCPASITKVAPREVICSQDDWFELLSSLRRTAVLDRSMDAVVLGGWAKSPDATARNKSEFTLAWARFQPTLKSDTEMPAHESLRLSLLAMLAAFGGSAIARKPFSVWRALAIIVFAGAIVTAASQILAFAEPLLTGTASPVSILAAKVVICLLGGLLIDRFAIFDAKKVLSSEPK